MKIILSRKGFDSSSGGQASPILPDGTLLSLPIPSNDDTQNKLSELFCDNQTYLDIIKSLKPSYKNADYCHLDPDLIPQLRHRDSGWRPAFGQVDSSLSVLRKNGVSIGDLFIFFGWFRETEYNREGLLKYKRQAPDQHIIYGYLQIGEIIEDIHNLPHYLKQHPHAAYTNAWNKHKNAIFIATDRLSFAPELPGSGTLKLRSDRILTKPGLSRRCWQIPDCFKEVNITYHPHPWKDGYFESAGRGQEFIMDSTPSILNWAKSIIL